MGPKNLCVNNFFHRRPNIFFLPRLRPFHPVTSGPLRSAKRTGITQVPYLDHLGHHRALGDVSPRDLTLSGLQSYGWRGHSDCSVPGVLSRSRVAGAALLALDEPLYEDRGWFRLNLSCLRRWRNTQYGIKCFYSTTPAKALVDRALRAQCFRALSFYSSDPFSARPSSSFVTRFPKTWSIL